VLFASALRALRVDGLGLSKSLLALVEAANIAERLAESVQRLGLGTAISGRLVVLEQPGVALDRGAEISAGPRDAHEAVLDPGGLPASLEVLCERKRPDPECLCLIGVVDHEEGDQPGDHERLETRLRRQGVDPGSGVLEPSDRIPEQVLAEPEAKPRNTQSDGELVLAGCPGPHECCARIVVVVPNGCELRRSAAALDIWPDETESIDCQRASPLSLVAAVAVGVLPSLEAFGCVASNRLEHPVPRSELGLASSNEALVEQ